MDVKERMGVVFLLISFFLFGTVVGSTIERNIFIEPLLHECEKELQRNKRCELTATIEKENNK